MLRVILDTSFILTALKFKIDIKSQLSEILDEKFSIHYIDKTLNELKGKPLEKLAKLILKNMKAIEISTSSKTNVDNLILEHVETHQDDLVATQDIALKEKLKKRNIRLITIRQKSRLKLIN